MPAKVVEADCSEATRARAKQLYAAYCANSGGLNYQGLRCPLWENLPAEIRGHWCAVVLFADSSIDRKFDDSDHACECNPATAEGGRCVKCGGKVSG